MYICNIYIYIYMYKIYTYIYIYMYVYVYTNLTVNAIARLPHSWSRDSQGQVQQALTQYNK